MYSHPSTSLDIAHQRHRELLDRAARERRGRRVRGLRRILERRIPRHLERPPDAAGPEG